MSGPSGDALRVAKIVEDATGRVVWQSEPSSPRAADRMAAGAGRNLDWDRFSVVVEDAPGEAGSAGEARDEGDA